MISDNTGRTGDPLIIVRDLRKTFRNASGVTPVLKGIDIDIHKGEKVVIVGPSGSGKSTFLRCLNMLETPTAGSVIFEGTDLTGKKVDLDLHRRKMGMVFQQFNLFPHKTVLENMILAPMCVLAAARRPRRRP